MNKYDDFFGFYENFIRKREEDKKHFKEKGINDYNLITSLLKFHDEVRLHSRFIASMLNPVGAHNQFDEFLKLFLEKAGLVGFIDTENASVDVEIDNIDIRISDGSRYIIIENKIYAGDGIKQVERYVDHIVNDINSRGMDVSGSVAFLYMAYRREKPGDHSLGSYKITGSGENLYLEKDKGETRIEYKNLDYETGIIGWVDACLKHIEKVGSKEVKNVEYAFNEYKCVVERLCKTYKKRGEIMSLYSYLNGIEDADKRKQLINDMKSLPRNIDLAINESARLAFEEKIPSLMEVNKFLKGDKNHLLALGDKISKRVYSGSPSVDMTESRRGKNKNNRFEDFWWSFYLLGIDSDEVIVVNFGVVNIHFGKIKISKDFKMISFLGDVENIPDLFERHKHHREESGFQTWAITIKNAGFDLLDFENSSIKKMLEILIKSPVVD